MRIGEVTPRADGKFLVTIIFSGGPNGFGGSYPPKVFRKIVNAEKLAELRQQAAPQEAAQ